MKKYFLHNGTEQKGAYTIEELKQMDLTADLMIWHEGLVEWTEISNVPELKNLLKSEPTPPLFIQRTPPPPFNPKPQINSNFNSSEKNAVFKEYKIGFIMLLLLSVVGIIISIILLNGDRDYYYDTSVFATTIPFFLIWFILLLLCSIIFYVFSDKQVPKVILSFPYILIVSAVLDVLFVHYTWNLACLHNDTLYISSIVLIGISVLFLVTFTIRLLTNKNEKT